MTSIAVRVPEQDAADLADLLTVSGSNEEVVVARPFDGETVAQTVLLLSGPTFAFFETWLRNRAQSRKSYSVVIDGTQLSGYTPTEVERILEAVHKQVPKKPRDGE
ncbi:hypothetical protein [Frigoribacterium sp. VKM Ac-2530]|uniref:hypothetical protein n=1 Tax=Frigoribacterium sp. VKM Ac-2530 TaxID=2783822 RepID=UPI00188D9B6E|nr:hypothetical protein [Frigoribacterium sp. VKM Ac-2530]MBF4580782.1 hypothetical protein [Frigoribacterium sp. VKM Ac-2530]